MLPVVNGLSKTYGSRIKFVRINIHDPKTKPIQDQLGFSTTPEFLLLDPQGRILHEWEDDLTVAGAKQVFDTLGN